MAKKKLDWCEDIASSDIEIVHYLHDKILDIYSKLKDLKVLFNDCEKAFMEWEKL